MTKRCRRISKSAKSFSCFSFRLDCISLSSAGDCKSRNMTPYIRRECLCTTCEKHKCGREIYSQSEEGKWCYCTLCLLGKEFAIVLCSGGDYKILTFDACARGPYACNPRARVQSACARGPHACNPRAIRVLLPVCYVMRITLTHG